MTEPHPAAGEIANPARTIVDHDPTDPTDQNWQKVGEEVRKAAETAEGPGRAHTKDGDSD